MILCVASPGMAGRWRERWVSRPLAERRKGDKRKENAPRLGVRTGYRHRASF